MSGQTPTNTPLDSLQPIEAEPHEPNSEPTNPQTPNPTPSPGRHRPTESSSGGGRAPSPSRPGQGQQIGTGQISTAQMLTFPIGVNLPWYDCGWDFGPNPRAVAADLETAWGYCKTKKRQAPKRWINQLGRDVRRLRAMGVSRLRVFILADGRLCDPRLTTSLFPRSTALWDSIYPAAMAITDRRTFRGSAQSITRDLYEFLRIFNNSRATNLEGDRIARPDPMTLTPVLCSFEMFGPKSALQGADSDYYFSCGRSECISNTNVRTQFLDKVLEPIIATLSAFSNLIDTVEIINEPEWCIGTQYGLGAADIQEFIRQVADKIQAHRLTPSVGFSSRAWMGSEAEKQLCTQVQKLGIRCTAHYYGVLCDPDIEPLNSTVTIYPDFVYQFDISEIGTGAYIGYAYHAPYTDHNAHWSQISMLRRLVRLHRTQDQPGPVVWAARTEDSHWWTDDVEDAIYSYHTGRQSPIHSPARLRRR